MTSNFVDHLIIHNLNTINDELFNYKKHIIVITICHQNHLTLSYKTLYKYNPDPTGYFWLYTTVNDIQVYKIPIILSIFVR